MILLHSEDVKLALPFSETIEAMKTAYAALSSGEALVPLRASLAIASYNGTSLFMPAFVPDDRGDSLTLKTVTVYPNNSLKGMPIIHAAVLVIDARNGKILALIEGSSLTAIRTGAASGAATDILAKQDANNAAIFGAGVQGKTQLKAVCSVRDIKTAWIYDPDYEKANAFIQEMSEDESVPRDIRNAKDPFEAASDADIICTATTSRQPVYPLEAIKPGTHINGIGSFTLEMIENPPLLFERATTYVDSIEAVMAEAGEIVEAVERNLLDPKSIRELGDVILGNVPGRSSDTQITFFKSVGVAVQDAVAARVALKNADEFGLGQKVDW